MRVLFLLLSLLFAPPAWAQQVTCATRPAGDKSNACASTAFVNNGGAGYITGLPLIGAPSGGTTQGTRSGSTTTYATASGTLSNGHCVSIDVYGNFIDAGAACTTGGGGGTVNAATAGQIAYYASSGNAVSGTATVKAGITGAFLNAKIDCGAVGDGVTDDTTALQTCLTNAAASNPNGSVYIPAGSYKITTALTVAAGIQIFGDGPAKTIINPANTIDAISVTTAAQVMIHDLGIIYPIQQNTGLYAISFNPTVGENGQSEVRNVQIAYADSGIQLFNTYMFTLDRGYIQDFVNTGIFVSDAAHVDNGDSVIENSSFFRYTVPSSIVGVEQVSSGGLRVINTKFGALQYGVLFLYTNVNGANTAQLVVANDSFDTMAVAAVSLSRQSGSTNVFNSIIISNNNMPQCNIGVSIPQDPGGNWLNSMVVSSNTWVGPNSASAVFLTMASVSNIAITSNVLFSNNASSTGIAIGSSVTTGAITANAFGGTFTTKIFNGGGTTIIGRGNAVVTDFN